MLLHPCLHTEAHIRVWNSAPLLLFVDRCSSAGHLLLPTSYFSEKMFYLVHTMLWQASLLRLIVLCCHQIVRFFAGLYGKKVFYLFEYWYISFNMCVYSNPTLKMFQKFIATMGPCQISTIKLSIVVYNYTTTVYQQ